MQADLIERVARMLAEYVEHGSADRMVGTMGGGQKPFWTRQVPFALDMIREVLAAMRGWTDEAGAADVEDRDVCEIILRNFAREHGLEPPGER